MTEKLVRDFIPLLALKRDGVMPKCRFPATKEEALKLFLAKLDEEVAELKEAMSNPVILDPSHPMCLSAVEEVAEEAADVFEVLINLVAPVEIQRAQRQKLLDRGGFATQVIMEVADRPKPS